MGLIRTTAIGGVTLGLLVWIMSPWVAKTDIVESATRLELSRIEARIDFPAMAARQNRMVAVTERARLDEHPTLAFAGARPVNADALFLIRSDLSRDPDFKRFRQGEGNVVVSSGFWRGFNTFTFQVTGGNSDRPSGILKVYMSFRLDSMAWKVVGIDILPAS